jgi:putative permease
MIKIFRKWMNRYFADQEAVLVVVLLVAAVVVLMTMGDILAPMIASIIIAFLMEGMVARLNGRGVPHIVSVCITFTVLVGAMALVLLVVLPGLWQQLVNLFTEIPRMLAQGRRVALLLPEQYPTIFSEQTIDTIIRNSTNKIGELGENILSISITKLPVFIGLLIYIVLVPILVFFFLKDGKKILHQLAGLLPDERPVMTKIWVEMNLQIANYVRGKAIEILVVTGVSFFAFQLLGLNYALLLAIAVGLSVVIPYIGAAVVTVPVAMIAYFQWGWTSEFMWVMVVYGIIQMLDGNVLVPLLFSEAVNLHPIAIILSVLVFGGIWGFWGIFFAIPLATLFKAIINAWPVREGRSRQGGLIVKNANAESSDDDQDAA